MDIQIEIPAVPYRDLSGQGSDDSSRVIKQRVEHARAIQRDRIQKDKIYCNAQMKNRHITKYCALDHGSQVLLERAMEGMGLSAQAYHRILKIARTIVDLEEASTLTSLHIAEAIQYRSLERKIG
jgi:magnesium chelatase family protein